MLKLQAIILAAGKSTRFNTTKSKLSYTICGQEMILYPIKLFSQVNIPVTLIVGYQSDAIRSIIKENSDAPIDFIEQKEQRGTGHAVLCSQDHWWADHLLIMNGDMPLVDQDIIDNLIQKHTQTDATITFVSAHNIDPSTSYGRIVKSDQEIAIVEAKDFTGDPSVACCINAGIYVMRRSFVQENLASLKTTPSGEINLTDLIALASSKKERVETVQADYDRVRGVNNLKELWAAEQIKRGEIINGLLHNGVRFEAAQATHVDLDVVIGSDTTIHAGAILYKGTRIGSHCTIGAFSIVTNSVIEDHVEVKPHTMVTDSHLATQTVVGPFAHIHQSTLGHASVAGNFVEMSRSHVGQQTKTKHLSYLGDTTVGNNVNIGAGTITCNHNGTSKEKTAIEDAAYIGSNCALIAPVTVGKGSIVAAGSVITQNVPADALAIARSRQTTKEQYAPIIKDKYKAAKESYPSGIKSNQAL